MAQNVGEFQKQFQKVNEHLMGCAKCRNKYATDHCIINEKIKHLGNIVQCCRDIARRILTENCEKKAQKDDVQLKPCNKSSRVVVKWK